MLAVKATSGRTLWLVFLALQVTANQPRLSTPAALQQPLHARTFLKLYSEPKDDKRENLRPTTYDNQSISWQHCGSAQHEGD